MTIGECSIISFLLGILFSVLIYKLWKKYIDWDGIQQLKGLNTED